VTLAIIPVMPLLFWVLGRGRARTGESRSCRCSLARRR